MDETKETETSSREMELLGELVTETKKSGEFAKRYAYVSFCLTILAIMIASIATIFTLNEQAGSILDFAVSAVIFAAFIGGAFWLMMRNPGFDED